MKKSLGLTIVYPTQKASQKEDYMNGKIIEINEEKVKDHLRNLVMRNSFQETLNAMLEAEADQLCQAQRHQRSVERQGH